MMRLLGSEWSFRETVLLFVLLFVALGFFFNSLALSKTVFGYKSAYSECMDSLTMAENGRLPLWDGSSVGNLSDFKP